MWSLDLFVLLLRKFKLFISSSVYHTKKNIQFLASRYCRIGTFHCVLCLVACGVMQVVLKKIAIVIRRTSKGNRVKIVARSFLVKTIRLNGMTRNFGGHSSGFGLHNVRRNDSRATWPVSEWCVSSYKLYRPKKGAAQYWDIMRFQPYCINFT